MSYKGFKIYNTYSKIKNILIKNNYKAFKEDKIIDFDILFENFNQKEFNETFAPKYKELYDCFLINFIFFVSDYVWNNKIYISKNKVQCGPLPQDDNPLPLICKELNLTPQYFGKISKIAKLIPNIEYQFSKNEKSVDDCFFTPVYVDIIAYMKTPLYKGTRESFYTMVSGQKYEILPIDELFMYFMVQNTNIETRIKITDRVYLRKINPKEKEFDKLCSGLFHLNFKGIKSNSLKNVSM